MSSDQANQKGLRKSGSADDNDMRRRRSSFVQRENLQREKTLFVGQYEDNVVLQHEIQEVVKEQGLTRRESMHRIKAAKSSVAEQRKSTSVQTRLAITNTMMGSAALVLPVNVIKAGLSLSMIVMTLMAVVSYYTCAYVVKIQIYGESDFSDIILRTLGKKWAKLFSFFSFLLLFLVQGVYFLLLNSVTFAFTGFIVTLAGGSLPDIHSMTWNEWSVQYQCLVLAIPLFFLISLKSLSFIIKLGGYGVLAVIGYIGFIIYIFIFAFTQSNFQQNYDLKMKQFTDNFGAVAGTFSLAFFIHNAVCQIMQNNQQQENNVKDLAFGYLNVYVIYGIVGILGSIGIVNNYDDTQPYSTICELFTSDSQLATTVPAQIVNLLFFFQLSTVLPILCFISRTQFYQMIFGQTHQITNLQSLLYNIAFLIECLAFQIFDIDPSIIIGISGAICGFYIVYILPFSIRFAAHTNASKRDSNFDSAYSDDTGQTQVKITEENTLAQQHDQLLVPNEETKQFHFTGKEGGRFTPIELTIWILVTIIGVLMAALQIYTLIQSLF